VPSSLIILIPLVLLFIAFAVNVYIRARRAESQSRRDLRIDGQQLVYEVGQQQLVWDLATADIRLDWQPVTKRQRRYASGPGGTVRYTEDTPAGMAPALFLRPAGESVWKCAPLFDPTGQALPPDRLTEIAEAIAASRPTHPSVSAMRRLADTHNPYQPFEM
jgi:hypothetical protein